MRRDRQASLKSVSILALGLSFGAMFSFTSDFSVAAPVVKRDSTGVIIANSKTMDSATRQITRTVTNETLKAISTKESEVPLADGLVVENLEDSGPVVLPAKILSQPSPGMSDSESTTREPAAAPEAKPTEKQNAPVKAGSPRTSTPVGAGADAGVQAEKALSWLKNGNERYLKKANRTDGKSQSDRDRLAKGQRPHTVVLACSDSRVPPEIVFDQSLGEIFVVRTAGESLDSAVLASIEYAVEHLGPRLIVVMGHTSCGAVGAAIALKGGETAGSPSLDALIADIKPRLPSRGPAGATSQALEIESASNAQGVAADLMSRSKIIRERVEKGELVIKPALYFIDSGNVKFY